MIMRNNLLLKRHPVMDNASMRVLFRINLFNMKLHSTTLSNFYSFIKSIKMETIQYLMFYL